MNENIYKNFADTLQKAIDPLNLRVKTTQISLTALEESLKNFANILATSLSPTEHFIETSKQLSVLYSIMLSKLTITDTTSISDDAFDFLDEIDFQDEYIEFTEENCDSINALLDLTDIENTSKVTPTNKTPTIQFIINVIYLSPPFVKLRLFPL